MESAHIQVAKLTYADLCAMPEDRLRHELIDGVHYVSPSASERHQRIVVEILAALHRYLSEHPSGRVYVSPLDVVLSDHDVVEPDVLYLTKAQAATQTGIHLHGAPALAVEVLSPGSRTMDLDLKRRVYDRFGVQEYWIVDPTRDAITVHRRSAGGPLTVAAELTRAAGDSLSTPLLPGFSCPLAVVFA